MESWGICPTNQLFQLLPKDETSGNPDLIFSKGRGWLELNKGCTFWAGGLSYSAPLHSSLLSPAPKSSSLAPSIFGRWLLKQGDEGVRRESSQGWIFQEHRGWQMQRPGQAQQQVCTQRPSWPRALSLVFLTIGWSCCFIKNPIQADLVFGTPFHNAFIPICLSWQKVIGNWKLKVSQFFPFIVVKCLDWTVKVNEIVSLEAFHQND